MEFIPAIDILDGQVVRLHQGRYDDVTVYHSDPAEAGKLFVDEGATRLHVVDLNGARDGALGNLGAIERLASLPLEVQVGGGIRTRDVAQRLIDAGARRVVLGTAAVRTPELVAALATEYSVIVAADARAGRVAIEGWLEGTEISLERLAADADRWSVEGILYTSIERDGTREGPDVEGTATLQRLVKADVIASGGVGTLSDLAALRDAGVRACVSGRALYGKTFTLAEAFAVSRGEREA